MQETDRCRHDVFWSPAAVRESAPPSSNWRARPDTRSCSPGGDEQRIQTVVSRTGAHGLHADVAVEADNVRTVAACRERMGGVDVLVNNAGYAYRAEIGAIELDSMRKMFDTNVFGLVDITNRVVPLMKAQGQGDIINIASTSGMKGGAGATAYGGSKWAVRGISQCWQAELRPHGIRVVCVCPSEVQTNFGGRTGRNNPNKLYAEDIAATIMAALAMPRRDVVARARGVRDQSLEGRLRPRCAPMLYGSGMRRSSFRQGIRDAATRRPSGDTLGCSMLTSPCVS